MNTETEKKLCKCGCGQPVILPTADWIRGHYFRNKKRPEHTQALLKRNEESGGVGGTGFFHHLAASIHLKSNCYFCNCTREDNEQEKELYMHCVSGYWWILNSWNWLTMCARCHRRFHGIINRMRTIIKKQINKRGKYNDVFNL